MPLGASITAGVGSTDRAGYRSRLLTKLFAPASSGGGGGRAPDSVDFVGSERSGRNMPGGDKYNRHEGHPGFTIAQVQRHLASGRLLQQHRPNVVLLHVGTNDVNGPPAAKDPKDRDADDERIAAAAAARLGALLDDVTAVCPNAVVLVAQLVRARPLGGKTDARIGRYNAHVRRQVQQRERGRKRVLLVDMSVVGARAEDMSDAIHPSDRGYDRMAGVWLAGMRAAAAKRWIGKACRT
jgi:lysophospholipase L1-like esterase